MFNSFRLNDEEDQLEQRMMDEFLSIEREIGEIKGVIGLQFVEHDHKTNFDPIVFPPKAPPAKKIIVNDDGEEEEVVEEEKPAEEENDGKPKFNPEAYKWTDSNRLQLNLPQLFCKLKNG